MWFPCQALRDLAALTVDVEGMGLKALADLKVLEDPKV